MSYLYVVSFVTYVVAELLKFFKLNEKYIPITNMFVGIISAVICMVTGVLPFDDYTHIFESVASCIIAALGAGGFYDIFNQKYGIDAMELPKESATAAVLGIPEYAVEAPITHAKDEVIGDEEKGVEG